MKAQELNGLHEEITTLIDQLDESALAGNPVEERARYLLNRLISADQMRLGREFADLKEFWLSSVDWCSELSKQLEKLIIMYEDLRG